MGAHYRSGRRNDNKQYNISEMSTVASQSKSAAKNDKGTANMKKAPSKFKSSYASMITEAMGEMKQKKDSSRQAMIKQIAGTSNTTPNALLITKTIKKMIEEDKLVPAAQAGHSGAGSFKISPQEKLRIKQEEKAAAKKEMKKAASTNSAAGAKRVTSKAAVGAKKVVKKSAKKPSKQVAQKGKGMKLMKKVAKKVGAKAKKKVAAAKKVKK